MVNNMFYNKPIFFKQNRVFRVYSGGKLMGQFLGQTLEDDNYPEEWIASNVHAMNEGSTDPYEGISQIAGTDMYFSDALAQYKQELLGDEESVGILVKYLDSAVRLPIQAHPTKAFSQKHFHSNHGKQECWYILDTRPNASIGFGFKEGVTEMEFRDAIEKSESDKTVMESILQMHPVKKGDVVFVPANMVHAIGAGCLILEVQEPTDFTIQPEHWCDNYHLSDKEMYLGLDKDTALECFSYETPENVFVQPKLLSNHGGVSCHELIGKDQTDCFSLKRYCFCGGKMELSESVAIYIVSHGEGKIYGKGYEQSVKQGDYFFLPASAKGFVIESDDLELLKCSK